MFRRDLLFLNLLNFGLAGGKLCPRLVSRKHSMAIRILATGGTFDKEYNERTGQLYFKDTHIAEMLRLGRSQVEVSIRTVMMTDSLEMTDADRNLIVQNCLQSAEDRIVITHGTDTMTETALSFAQALPPGVYIAIHGQCFPWDRVRKNRERGEFEEI